MQSFDYPSIVVLDQEEAPRKEYDRKTEYKNNRHYGQLKLFVSELDFILTYVMKTETETGAEPTVSKQKVILYIGAGPGNHLNYLIKMFPQIEFHLFDDHFDPRLEKLKNAFVNVRYFTEEDLKDYSEMANDPLVDLYVITDIRDLSYQGNKWNVNEEVKFIADMNLQRLWIEKIKAKYSTLKIRMPFPEKEVFELLGEESWEYLDGDILKQAWPRVKSIETRLVIPSENIKTKKYDLRKYEEQLAYHNAIVRQDRYNYVLMERFVGKKINEGFFFDDHFDSAYTVTALVDYFNRSSPGMSQDKIVERIVKIVDFVSRGERNCRMQVG